MGILYEVSQNRLEDVRDRLKSKKEGIAETDTSGNTALHLAAEKGFVEMVKLLVEFDAKLDSHNKSSGWTPLHFAAYEGNMKSYSKLILVLNFFFVLKEFKMWYN